MMCDAMTVVMMTVKSLPNWGKVETKRDIIFTISLHTHEHKKEKLMTDDKLMMSIADEND